MKCIELSVVVPRRNAHKLEFRLDEFIGRAKRSRRIPFLQLFACQEENIFAPNKGRTIIREILLNITRSPLMLIPFQRLVFKVSFEISTPSDVLEFKCFDADKLCSSLIFRKAALPGIVIPELDLSYGYEFKKNHSKYDVFLTNATILDLKEAKVLKNSFYFEQSPNFTIGQSNLTISGTKSSDDGWLEIRDYRNWKMQKISEAVVLHGQVIYKEGRFYFTDSSRIPGISNLQHWPSVIFINQNGRISTPRSKLEPSLIPRGIFVGGTNNFMHFVIEDLPRIILADVLKIPTDYALVFKANLSDQIKDTIVALTDRKIVYVDSFEGLQVSELIAFRFDNPLVSAMAGNQDAALNLFNSFLLKEARSRIKSKMPPTSKHSDRVLIERGRGLFRPLTNSHKLKELLMRDFGFAAFDLSGQRLDDVVNIFDEASIIVAEYGAGMANMIFANNNPTVLELRGPLESGSIEYEALAKACGFKHQKLVGKKKVVSRYGIERGPFSVDVNQVANKISELI
jgi:capsular polysaccharide biosynthesis protein